MNFFSRLRTVRPRRVLQFAGLLSGLLAAFCTTVTAALLIDGDPISAMVFAFLALTALFSLTLIAWLVN